MKPKFFIASLGCPKNTVDSDSMAQLLLGDGYSPAESADDADIIIVNTCGFIAAAKEESLAVLSDFAERKRPGQLLIAAGCLTQRYGEEVVRAVPGIDALLGTRRWMDILKVVRKLRKAKHPVPLLHLPDVPTVGRDEPDVLRATLQGGSAYLKIADGCRRGCAFCAIPLIKGALVSRPAEAIVREARILRDAGAEEIILIAQDTTDYGHDLGMKEGLASLLEEILAAVPDLPWLRVMYTFPGYVTDRLIDVMASHPQIVPYFDMPLQHADPKVLRSMRRPSNMDWVYRTLEKVRAAMPGVALRTTFIVGYPTEGENEFQALLDFVKEIRFDRLGAFQFSYEEGTPSAELGDPVPPEAKQARWEALMELQQGISLELNRRFVGEVMDVLIEGYDEEDNFAVGRTYRDAPEVDGLVLVAGSPPVGKIVPVRITQALHYDLVGEYVPKKTTKIGD